MSFIGSMLGAGKGSDWQATTAQEEKFLNPIDPNVAQNGVAQQQAFISALGRQAGGMEGQGAAFQGYQNLANGTGANPAQAMLAQATGANVANQAALAAGQRGASGNVGMMSRQAGMQGGNAMQQSAGQAATMQAQQQVQGLQGMAGVANAQVGEIGQQMQNYNQNNLGSIGSYNQALSGLYGSQNKTTGDIEVQNSKAQQGLLGGAFAGNGMLFSDERVKTDIKPAGDKIQAFLDAVGANQYSYKKSVQGLPGADSKQHVGPMAQELEKSELGSQMVQASPQGKMVDFQRGLGTIVSAQAQLNERLKALEGGEKPAKKMAGGGEVPSQGIPDFTGKRPMLTEINNTIHNDDPIRKGSSDLSGALVNKYIKPYTDPYLDSIKQSVTDFLHPNGPAGLGQLQQPEIGSSPMGRPTIGQTGDMADFGATPQGTGPSLGVNTDLAASAETAEGAEAAGATEGAEAAASEAAATEAAEAAATEAASSEVAAVAALSKGGKIQSKGKVPVLLSPGEGYLSPKNVKEVAKGKSAKEQSKVVPGKPKVKGDSERNDTVPAKLAPGGVVIPRSKMNSHQQAQDFVQALLAKSHMRRGKN